MILIIYSVHEAVLWAELNREGFASKMAHSQVDADCGRVAQPSLAAEGLSSSHAGLPTWPELPHSMAAVFQGQGTRGQQGQTPERACQGEASEATQPLPAALHVCRQAPVPAQGRGRGTLFPLRREQEPEEQKIFLWPLLGKTVYTPPKYTFDCPARQGRCLVKSQSFPYSREQ